MAAGHPFVVTVILEERTSELQLRVAAGAASLRKPRWRTWQAALSRGDFQDAQSIAVEAWERVTNYRETAWDTFLAPPAPAPQIAPVGEIVAIPGPGSATGYIRYPGNEALGQTTRYEGQEGQSPERIARVADDVSIQAQCEPSHTACHVTVTDPTLPSEASKNITLNFTAVARF